MWALGSFTVDKSAAFQRRFQSVFKKVFCLEQSEVVPKPSFNFDCTKVNSFSCTISSQSLKYFLIIDVSDMVILNTNK